MPNPRATLPSSVPRYCDQADIEKQQPVVGAKSAPCSDAAPFAPQTKESYASKEVSSVLKSRVIGYSEGR